MEALEWDDANRSHIARHGVTPEEVQELFDRNPIDLGSDEENSEFRFSYIGDTAHGRILLIVATERGDRLRPVTAFEPGISLRKQFLQSRRMQDDE